MTRPRSSAKQGWLPNGVHNNNNINFNENTIQPTFPSPPLLLPVNFRLPIFHPVPTPPPLPGPLGIQNNTMFSDGLAGTLSPRHRLPANVSFEGPVSVRMVPYPRPFAQTLIIETAHKPEKIADKVPMSTKCREFSIHELIDHDDSLTFPPSLNAVEPPNDGLRMPDLQPQCAATLSSISGSPSKSDMPVLEKEQTLSTEAAEPGTSAAYSKNSSSEDFCSPTSTTPPTFAELPIHGPVSLLLQADQRFTCRYCGYETSCLGRLKVHMGRNFPCKICNQTFCAKWDYERHKETHKDFKCILCNQKFTYLYEFESHALEHFERRLNFECFVASCTSHCQSTKTFRVHMRRFHRITSSNPVECKQCNSKIFSTNALLKHVFLEHENNKETRNRINKNKKNVSSFREWNNFDCIVADCDRHFDYYEEFELHVKLVHIDPKNPSVECRFCGKFYSNTLRLVRHYVTIHETRSVECEKMLTRSTSTEKMNENEVSTEEEVSSESSDVASEAPCEEEFMYQECCASISRRGEEIEEELKEYNDCESNSSPSTSGSEPPPLISEIKNEPDADFEPTPPDLTIKQEVEDMHCYHCNISFTSKEVLDYHDSFHSYNDPFMCSSCGIRSQNSQTFLDHFAYYH